MIDDDDLDKDDGEQAIHDNDNTVRYHLTTFRSMTDCIYDYDGDLLRLQWS